MKTPQSLQPAFQQFVTVCARVRSPAELYTSGEKRSTVFVDKSMAPLLSPPPGKRLWASEQEADGVAETLLSLIQAALHDPDLEAAIAAIPREPAPLFRQFADHSLGSDGQPRFAAKMDESIGALDIEGSEKVTQSQNSEQQQQQQQQQEQDEQQGSLTFPAVPLPAAFLSVVETILDNTIANILAEAEAGEFNITARTITR